MQLAPLSNRKLTGKVAIVTGASRGIGLAIADQLVSDGAQVCLTARNLDPLLAIAERFPEGTVLPIAGKVDDVENCLEVLSTVMNSYGRLDIIVNNVGINPAYGSLLELDIAAGRKIMEVNLFGALSWVQNAIRFEALNFYQGGTVVNVSSITGQIPAPGIGMYGISKAALDQFTRTLAVELAPRIRVNAVAPAVVKTDFAKALYEGKEEQVAAEYPMARLGTPKDVASLVSFLASDQSSWITGQVINIDGGLLVAGGTA